MRRSELAGLLEMLEVRFGTKQSRTHRELLRAIHNLAPHARGADPYTTKRWVRRWTATRVVDDPRPFVAVVLAVVDEWLARDAPPAAAPHLKELNTRMIELDRALGGTRAHIDEAEQWIARSARVDA